jgi:hypothetical protein
MQSETTPQKPAPEETALDLLREILREGVSRTTRETVQQMVTRSRPCPCNCQLSRLFAEVAAAFVRAHQTRPTHMMAPLPEQETPSSPQDHRPRVRGRRPPPTRPGSNPDQDHCDTHNGPVWVAAPPTFTQVIAYQS